MEAFQNESWMGNRKGSTWPHWSGWHLKVRQMKNHNKHKMQFDINII